MQLKTFTFNPFMENTYVLFDETKKAVIIDPGCHTKQERMELLDFLKTQGLTPVKLLNTHCHIDHVLGNAFVKSSFDIPLWHHKLEEQILRAVPTYASNYGFPQYQDSSADHYIADGEVVTFGNQKLETIFVPGHSPGHVVFFHRDTKTCIGGDTLFQGSVGRTDLPGGDSHTLLTSIRERMFSLPDDAVVHPGHGPATTIGEEKLYNPFVGKNARL
nr:MBL fold metallo-hydrolase [Cytophagales bacterium]